METKSLSEFNVRKKYKQGRHYLCKGCKRKEDKVYRSKPDGNGINAERRNHLKRKYGLSSKQYIDLYNEQHGLCAITGLPLDTLRVDHDKHTGEVRGMINNQINLGLGAFDHNPEWLRCAADYLERKRGPRHA